MLLLELGFAHGMASPVGLVFGVERESGLELGLERVRYIGISIHEYTSGTAGALLPTFDPVFSFLTSFLHVDQNPEDNNLEQKQDIANPKASVCLAILPLPCLFRLFSVSHIPECIYLRNLYTLSYSDEFPAELLTTLYSSGSLYCEPLVIPPREE